MSENNLPGFEASMQQLESILERMNDKDISLDQSIECYAKAAELIQFCNQSLAEATVKVEEIDAKLQEMRESE